MTVSGPSRGYILEVYNGHFQLPNLGPIGQFNVCGCDVSTIKPHLLDEYRCQRFS